MFVECHIDLIHSCFVYRLHTRTKSQEASKTGRLSNSKLHTSNARGQEKRKKRFGKSVGGCTDADAGRLESARGEGRLGRLASRRAEAEAKGICYSIFEIQCQNDQKTKKRKQRRRGELDESKRTEGRSNECL